MFSRTLISLYTRASLVYVATWKALVDPGWAMSWANALISS